MSKSGGAFLVTYTQFSVEKVIQVTNRKKHHWPDA